jgi:isopentenyl phosphate kinase
VQRGDLNTPLVKAGLVATRISVTKLNHEVVRHFASEGIPAVGISPLSAGWCTKNKNFKEDDMMAVECTVNAGFIPVVHGDGVLDSAEGCSILSGDLIVRQLAKGLKPSFVVFLTNVPGVFDRPPSEPNAVLLKEIVVHEDCSWVIVDPPLGLNNTKMSVQITVAAHDTTGGMAGKISEAAFIAAMGIDVYIVQAGTPHALEALKGNVKCSESKKRWIGTLVRSAQS